MATVPAVVTVRVPRVTYNRFTTLRVRPSDAILSDLGRLDDVSHVTEEFVESLSSLAQNTVPVMLTLSQIKSAGVLPAVEAMAQQGRDLGTVIGLVVASASGDGSPRRTGRVVPKGSIPVVSGDEVPSADDLKVMRLQRNWTQQELAERAGLMHKIVSEVESGQRKNEHTRLYLARILTNQA